ncbi:alpha-ketoglutarate-dependent dioxygenase AlkB [Hymenobacter endophyticus]|uniref:Alpha-ketoglutarate-dependent dioxygenase AlkB n=1 Tax=Hymenobacter endophyticus TaxID=3076335 RepID=A0ABU3TCL2_9BACT|nr:alpha-ketoglutarate-dependent dioxygenase AlkB [Hymenobacter endophyticus]MDU0369106.1 alpha-ketoglutarate-dependent dioxygenase AlkB [Hymenobacter endophyticus]
MNFSLFNPTEPIVSSKPVELIPGLQYLPDYVDTRLQSRLLTCIDESPWQDDLKRRVQHYGYRYDYKSRRIDRSQFLGVLPSWCLYYAQQFFAAGYFADAPPDQVIVNEYKPGQGIAPHVDCTPCFDDTIISISLGSACVMNLSRIDDPTLVFDQILMPGSAIILQGEARFKWRHGIRPVKHDTINGRRVTRQRRVSLTFRKVRLG